MPVGEEVVVVADYGASQGRNSMAPMRVAIAAMRTRRGLDKPVLVFHTDLPSNDFSSLFSVLDDDQSSYLSGSRGVYSAAVGRSFFGTVLPLWTHLWDTIVELGNEGQLTEAEQLRVTVPIWYRSIAELRAPFGSEGHYAGLRLQHLEAISAPDPFWESFVQTGDAEAFGTVWANIMRAISAPTLLGALTLDRADLVDEVFQRYAVRIAAAPIRYDWDLAAVVASKAP